MSRLDVRRPFRSDADLSSPQRSPEIGDSIDELLVFRGAIALRDGEGLAMSLGLESRRPDIRNPDLDGTKPLAPQALTIRLHLLSR